MNPWIEALGATALAAAGVLLGRWFGRLRKPYWLLGYAFPLFAVCAIGLARRFAALEFMPPLSWLMAGRTEFALTALITPMVLTTPLSRLKGLRTKRLVVLVMVLLTLQCGVLPFLAPAFNRSYLRSLTTQVDADGVCLQSNDYNCGPAAAVTALRHLNFAAEEGEIAILARSTRFTGTETDVLAKVLERRYGAEGLRCVYRRFHSVAELDGPGVTIARMKFALLLDHYVTVLKVTDAEVMVGDPLFGKRTLSHEDFSRNWRYRGIVLRRDE